MDESSLTIDGLQAVDLARTLALAKANDVARSFPSHLVIGADTVVESDGLVFGKPKDASDAERMLNRLFAKPHRVITAIAIVRRNPSVQSVDADITTIYPRPLHRGLLSAYLASRQWEGKAGGYGIQEEGCEPFIERIDGSFTNVVGMPMELLARMLRDIGYQAK